VILDVLFWLAVADAVAAGLFAMIVFVVGRRSGRPVPLGSAIAIAAFLALPAALLYLVAWLWSQVNV
jgi:uncharacterized membrane protein YhfC